MKRSQINSIMRSADNFINECGFFLPPFAYWTPEIWEQKGPAVSEIVNNWLGWDITDFGTGNFEEIGLFLFTIRNGSPDIRKPEGGKPYSEKLLVVGEGQVTPMHFHWKKMEDIINRGGGNLIIQVYRSTPNEEIDYMKDVAISTDGMHRTLPAGGLVTLTPGESITLPPYCYHKFWGDGGRVLVGEVSTVNDDSKDNRFAGLVGRFPVIEEDEPPLYLLVNDYERYYQYFGE